MAMAARDDGYELFISISLRSRTLSDTLSVHDNVTLPHLNFVEMAELLVQFQSIVDDFKARINDLRSGNTS
jgi:hypothetical protein